MRKKYNTLEVIQRYTRRFLLFMKENSLVYENKRDLYELFMYSLKSVFGVDAVEYNPLISIYGTQCTAYLMSTKNVPKRLDLEDTTVLIEKIGNCFVRVMKNREGERI